MKDYPFPDPPEQPEFRWYKRIPSVYFWWIGSVFLLGVAIIWLPTQCVLDDFGGGDREPSAESKYRQANQDEDLEFRKDGLWYEIQSDVPFTGFGQAYHPNGKLRSRTKIKDGVAYGLIEEWDENGSILGTPFKDEFPR